MSSIVPKFRPARVLLILTICFVSLPYLVTLFGPWNIYLDMVSHFIVQIAIVGILSVLLTVAVTRQLIYLSLLSIVIFPIITELPINFPASSISKGDIYYINMNYFNRDITPIINSLEKSESETVVITELTSGMSSELKELYNYSVIHTERAFSCGIFSQEKPLSSIIHHFTYPTCLAEFKSFTIITVHPYPPFNKSQWESQKIYFEEVRKVYNQYQKAGKNPILIGDFNSSNFSPVFKKYFGDIRGANTNYTWSTNSILALPLDHALGNKVESVSVAPLVSSDHAPLIIKLVER